jgi:hypothetical protein
MVANEIISQINSFSSQAARGYFCEATLFENSKREEVFSVALRYTESNAQHGCRSPMSSFRREMCSCHLVWGF